jgi:hypothetical protein
LKVYTRLLSFTQHKSFWAFNPFFPYNEGQPLLGSIHPKILRDKEMGGIMMESGKYCREQYDGSSRDFLIANPSPRKTTY